MSKGSRLASGQGVTRRGFTAGALGAGLVLGNGRAPALAQGKRDLRVGVWGGEFGNLSAVIRYDIQGGLVLYNIFDSLVEINFAKRTIEPMLALEWANPDPLTWRIKLREGVKWQKGFGEFTAEDVVYCWNFHLESKSFQVGTSLFPLDSVKTDGKYVVEVRKDTNFVVKSTPGWEWDYQQFNLTVRPDLPYRNKLVRQAISYAIDREAIVNEIFYGEAIATDNQIPAGYMGHRGPMLKYPKNGDLKKAKELMAQAGVKGYEVDVITSDNDWLRQDLELVAAMVSQIGITDKINNI